MQDFALSDKASLIVIFSSEKLSAELDTVADLPIAITIFPLASQSACSVLGVQWIKKGQDSRLQLLDRVMQSMLLQPADRDNHNESCLAIPPALLLHVLPSRDLVKLTGEALVTSTFVQNLN